MNRSNEILHAYLQVSRHISEKFRIYYGKLNLTYPQSIVLAILEADGPMPISALAEAAGSANGAISGVVNRLEKMELVAAHSVGLRPPGHLRLHHGAIPGALRQIQGDRLRPLFRRPEHPLPQDAQAVERGLMLLDQALQSEEG